MEQMRDLLIIGGGPAGYTAAIYGARAGYAPLVLEQTGPGGQMATTDRVENYPGFPQGIGGPELALLMQQQAHALGAETQLASVVEVDISGETKTIVTDQGTYRGKAVIIATGATPRPMNIPGEAELRGMGVSYCATCDGFFFKNREVCVVGGGDTALLDALYLSQLCKRVILVHRRDTFRGAKSLVNRLAQRDNISLYLDRIPLKVNGTMQVDSLTLQHVPTGAQEDVPCDGVFVAVGQTPHTHLFRGKLAMDEGGYLLADESTMATALSGVFCAGDVRKKNLYQILTAAADGAVAAVSAERYLSGLE